MPFVTAEARRAWRQENRDRLNEYQRERYAANLEHKRAEARRYYAQNAEVMRQRSRDKYAANREGRLEYQRAYNRDNAEAIRDARRKKKYDLSPVGFAELLEKQGYSCAICGQSVGESGLDVDHNHETGVVRGLLCSRCNHGIGNFRDNATLLAIASAYVGEDE